MSDDESNFSVPPTAVTRVARRLSGEREIEAEAEPRGRLIRLRASLFLNGFLFKSFNVTASVADLMTDPEIIPKEFSCDSEVYLAVMEPVALHRR